MMHDSKHKESPASDNWNGGDQYRQTAGLRTAQTGERHKLKAGVGACWTRGGCRRHEDGDEEVAVTASSMGSSLLSATAFLAVGWEEVLDLASKLSQLRITMASPRAASSPLWLRTNPLSMQA